MAWVQEEKFTAALGNTNGLILLCGVPPNSRFPLAPPCNFKRQFLLGFNNCLRSALTLRGVSSVRDSCAGSCYLGPCQRSVAPSAAIKLRLIQGKKLAGEPLRNESEGVVVERPPRAKLDLSQLDHVLARSVHSSTADIRRLHRHVRFVPNPEVSNRSKGVVTAYISSSSERWGPQQHPHPWHSRAGWRSRPQYQKHPFPHILTQQPQASIFAAS